MATIPITIGEAARLALVLEDGDTAQFPQVNIYEPGNATPLATLDLDHTAEGYYESSYTPASIGPYNAVYTVYTDVGHTTPSTKYSKELDQIIVRQDIASIIEEIHEKVTILLGLNEENYFIDNTEYDDCCQVVTSRIRVFDTPGNCNAATDGGTETTGLLATYQVTVDYEGPAKMKTYRKVKL